MNNKNVRSPRFFQTWFISRSLTADYGTFVCGCCKREFYHSPSEITRDEEVVYECCCGHCTNAMIQADHHEEPYHA